jgi:1-acyl-sn-glycerol-3-phosphate acyltransferase
MLKLQRACKSSYVTHAASEKFEYAIIIFKSMDIRFSWWYYAGRWLSWLAFRLLTDWKVEGKDNVPPSGPLLVVANHLNNADPPLVAISVPRKTYFMAKEELFRNPVIRSIIHDYGAFPIHRGKFDLSSLHNSRKVLENDLALVMFPEGMRSITPGMKRAFPGSAVIAVKNRAVILPVAIAGTEKLVGKTWWLRRHKVIVKIGKPFVLPVDGRVGKNEVRELADSMMYHIADLLPSDFRGCYSTKAKPVSAER